jgi:hypothetical protein
MARGGDHQECYKSIDLTIDKLRSYVDTREKCRHLKKLTCNYAADVHQSL